MLNMFISLINDMLQQQIKRLDLKAKMFRGFGDITRLSILELLKDDEKTVTQVAKSLKQSQSNISNHLACLSECGLVTNRRDGKNRIYKLADKKVKKLLNESDKILSDIAIGIYTCVHYKE